MPDTDATLKLNAPQLVAWLRLARADGIGPQRFRALLARTGDAAGALDMLAAEGPRLGFTVRIPSRAAAEDEIAWHAARGIALLPACDPAYPALLAQTATPPPVLSVAGDPALLTRRAAAIVGARNASASGQRLAGEIAAGLAHAGVAVVSGLARGIDTAAHRASLDGGTVAVLAGGIDRPYPPQNRDLAAAIAEGGAVVAELPPGCEPKARHFPRRNRVIAGLSLGVVVIEAAARSGSLITARFALEEGREVFAVPGSPLDPRSRGGNDLLRQGAHLTETADDVLEALPASGWMPAPRAAEPPDLLAPEPDERAAPEAFQSGPDPSDSAPDTPHASIRALLGPTPVTVDELVRRCQLSPAAVASVLLDLELEGVLVRLPGQQVSLA